MTKICIICPNPADSAEHVFPASFGGRRTNGGIYCDHHNQAFGRHVSVLLNSFDIVNAAIGVIPDRQKEVRPALLTTKDGEKYQFSKNEANIAPPRPLNETPEILGQEVVLPFASQAQADKWLKAQKKAGYDVKMKLTEPFKTQIIAQPLHTQKAFGDEAFRRAVLYLAVTFLAHFKPSLARSDGVKAIREIIERDETPGNRVLWEPPSNLEQLKPNPYTYGHTIAIGPISTTNRIGGIISFFGKLSFSIDFGEIQEATDLCCITIHIDPLAKSAVNDINVIEEHGGKIKVSSLEESKSYLQELRTGKTIHPITSILEHADKERLLETCKTLLPKLNDLKDLRKDFRFYNTVAVLANCDQRFFNFIQKSVRGFLESASQTSNPQEIEEVCNDFIKIDSNAPRGISIIGEAALQIIKENITKEICIRMDHGTLDEISLAELLEGTEGLRITLLTLTDLIAQTLSRR